MLSQPRCWSFRWFDSGGRTVVRFTGPIRLDEPAVESLTNELLDIGLPELRLDFRQATCLDGPTREALPEVRKRLTAAGQGYKRQTSLLRAIREAVSELMWLASGRRHGI